MATAEELLADPELLGSSWNLDPIVDGQGSAGVERLLDEALQRRSQSRRSFTPARWPLLDATGLRDAMRELAEIFCARGPRRQPTRCCSSQPTPRTRRAGRCCRRCEERGTTLETQLLFFELEWAALEDAQVETLLLNSGVDLEVLRPPPSHRPALPAAPAVRAGGADHGREVASPRAPPGRDSTASRSPRSA